MCADRALIETATTALFGSGRTARAISAIMRTDGSSRKEGVKKMQPRVGVYENARPTAVGLLDFSSALVNVRGSQSYPPKRPSCMKRRDERSAGARGGRGGVCGEGVRLVRLDGGRERQRREKREGRGGR
jgi:hypothetical protein